MARYIDAEKLPNAIGKALNKLDVEISPLVLTEICITVGRTIKNIPTADVVEVVRCEKCKHLTVHNSPTLYAYCEKTHYEFKPFETDTRTHFCSYGERRAE